MRPYIILLALILAPATYADSAADQLIAFKKMEARHKDDWFNHMKEVHNKKYDLLKKTHHDWVNFGVQAIEHEMHLDDCSGPAKDQMFTQRLHEAVHLHSQHNAEHKKLCQQEHEKALAINARHEKELEPYIRKYVS